MRRLRRIAAAALAAALLPGAAAGQGVEPAEAPSARERCADACRAAEAACYEACGAEPERACLNECIGKADVCFDRCEARPADADRRPER